MIKESTSILEKSSAVFHEMSTQVVDILPRIIVAIIILVLGWLLARLVRLLVIRAINRLDHFWQRFISKRGLTSLQPRHPPARVVGELVFWLLMLLFVTFATEILGLGIFAMWLKEIVTHLPLAAAGLLILLVGFVVSSLTRDLVASAADTTKMAHGDLLGRAAQAIILFIAIVLGIDQIGIDVTFIYIIAGVVMAAVLGGVSFAFGLGARTHVSNILAANQVRQVYQIGDKIRIDDTEGQIVDIMISQVVVETEAGRAVIPAKLFNEKTSLILEKGA